MADQQKAEKNISEKETTTKKVKAGEAKALRKKSMKKGQATLQKQASLAAAAEEGATQRRSSPPPEVTRFDSWSISRLKNPVSWPLKVSFAVSRNVWASDGTIAA
jgi:hypothetical protein